MRYIEMELPEEIRRAVEELGFDEMTEVQEKAISPMLEGRDVVAKAPTGTGKTCAFGIPLLLGIDMGENAVQSLVLAPTRELAQQIAGDLCDLAKFMPQVRIACVYGGQPIQRQVSQLKKSPQILIATPGRLMDHVARRNVSLARVTRVILDEADEMLDMGFYKDVVKILDSLKSRKQMGMFSATMSRPVMDISWLYQRDPVEVVVEPVAESMPKITQYSILTDTRGKIADTADIIGQGDYGRVMVFCNTKYTTAMLAGRLMGLGLDVGCLNGDMIQSERNRVMSSFKEGNLRILVSTDVAARGIDISDVDAVISFDVPPSNDYYIHRIGRTGRAKREGVSYILYLEDEARRLRDIIRFTRSRVIPARFDGERRLIAEES
ncbi:MAG: DEAD/DEAH box helicase [Oscillospiraceae bacterium]|jgi:ATP-dependent RNA helicase DeaD|nr:DEAD/DEAH box helicase [Oscillospiraceae bacterium]